MASALEPKYILHSRYLPLCYLHMSSQYFILSFFSFSICDNKYDKQINSHDKSHTRKRADKASVVLINVIGSILGLSIPSE